MDAPTWGGGRLFERLEIDLAPGVAGKHTAPEDIASSPLPHVKYLLLREIPEMKTVVFAKKIKPASAPNWRRSSSVEAGTWLHWLGAFAWDAAA